MAHHLPDRHDPDRRGDEGAQRHRVRLWFAEGAAVHRRPAHLRHGAGHPLRRALLARHRRAHPPALRQLVARACRTCGPGKIQGRVRGVHERGAATLSRSAPPTRTGSSRTCRQNTIFGCPDFDVLDGTAGLGMRTQTLLFTEPPPPPPRTTPPSPTRGTPGREGLKSLLGAEMLLRTCARPPAAAPAAAPVRPTPASPARQVSSGPDPPRPRRRRRLDGAARRLPADAALRRPAVADGLRRPSGAAPRVRPSRSRASRGVPVPVAQQRAPAAGRMRGQRRGERGSAPARAVAAVGVQAGGPPPGGPRARRAHPRATASAARSTRRRLAVSCSPSPRASSLSRARSWRPSLRFSFQSRHGSPRRASVESGRVEKKNKKRLFFGRAARGSSVRGEN